MRKIVQNLKVKSQMRQLIVAAANARGEFVMMNRMSDGAESSGLTRQQIVENHDHFWDFVDPSSAQVIRSRFADCLMTGDDQHYMLTSTIGGHVEHWENRLYRCSQPAEVIAVAREIFPSKTPTVSDRELTLLRGLCDDKTLSEIADESGEVESTLQSRLARLRERLGCRTTTGLIALCVRYGILRERS